MERPATPKERFLAENEQPIKLVIPPEEAEESEADSSYSESSSSLSSYEFRINKEPWWKRLWRSSSRIWY